jgi:DNA-binding FrmR family transcriptional regulator
MALAPSKAKALLAFKKAYGLLGKIVTMTENNEYCINVMQQNMAAIGLLKSAHQILMENHLNSCFKQAVISKNSLKQQKMIDEILTVTKLNSK